MGKRNESFPVICDFPMNGSVIRFVHIAFPPTVDSMSRWDSLFISQRLGYAMSFMRLSNITRKGFDMIIIVSSIFFACWRGCFFHLAKPSLMAWFLRFVIIFLFSFFGRFDMQQPLLVVKNSLSRRLCRICVLRKCTTTVNECFICTLYYSILQMSMPRSPWLCDERYCSSWDVNNVFLELKEKHQRKKDCRENREKNTTDQLPCLTNMG